MSISTMTSLNLHSEMLCNLYSSVIRKKKTIKHDGMGGKRRVQENQHKNIFLKI
jgi:hypothetical protein